MARQLRKLSLVKVKKKWAVVPSVQNAPFFNDQPLVFLGEIPNMPGHGVFIGHGSGRVYSGWHIFYFTELDEDET